MEYKELGKTGLSLSVIGFGASPLGNVFRDVDPVDCNRAVHYAIDSGINFFDVSPYYGQTLAEHRLGDALAGRRKEIILATKCGRYGVDQFDFSRSRLLNSIDESLARLRTDYVDLLQLHDIEFGDERQIVEESIPALEEIRRQGKARFIGITSYQLGLMVRVLEAAALDTVLSYCRYNLLIDDMDAILLPAVRSSGFGLINASPLHMGLLAAGTPPPWHPAPDAVRKAGAAVVACCERHGVEPAQIALRFCIDHPYVTSTLIGMLSEEQVRGNLRALDHLPDGTLLAEIRSLVAPVKNIVWPSGKLENADYLRTSIDGAPPSV